MKTIPGIVARIFNRGASDTGKVKNLPRSRLGGLRYGVVAGATLLAIGAARAADLKAVASVPITIHHSLIMVPGTVNGSEPLSFLLDTGYSMTMLRRDLAEKLELPRVGEITVEGIAGEQRAPTYSGAVFNIGGATHSARRVGAMPDTRRRRDGIIGAGLFRQYVVMVDPSEKRLELFSRTNFQYSGKGESVPLRFRRSTPIVEAFIGGTNQSVVKGSFEIDTGCDSGVCLASSFSREHHLLDPTLTRNGVKAGVGGDAATQSGHLPSLSMGSQTVEKPQTDFFTQGSPVDDGLAGHIGMGVLSQFRIYFDYANQRMILEKLAK